MSCWMNLYLKEIDISNQHQQPLINICLNRVESLTMYTT